MNTKFLPNRALSVIDQYRHFTIGNSVCSVPYFNNKTARARGALRAYVGKGSPKDIYEEVESFLNKEHLPADQLSDTSLKKLLVDHNIGIDCSGFVYYVLNAYNEESDKGSIDKHLSFINCTGILGKIRCSLRPAENCDVATLAHDKNSNIVSIADLKPGDLITMISASVDETDNEHDHVLVIHQTDYQNFFPTKLYYSHAVAYPEDGVYGNGIRQGTIEVPSPNISLTSCRWIEDGKEGQNNRIFIRANRSNTEIRRLKWM